MVSVFRGISKYKSIPLKTYNGLLTFCQGRGGRGGSAEKTTGGGAGGRREGRRALPQRQSCMSECVCVCLCETFRNTGLIEEGEMSSQPMIEGSVSLVSLQVTASALYRTKWMTLFLPFPPSISVRMPQRGCLFLCLVGSRAVRHGDPIGKICGPEGVAVM